MDKDIKKIEIVVWIVSGLLALGVAIWVAPFKIVGAGERGVVLRLGAVNRVIGEGINYKAPFVEHVKILDIKTQKEEAKVTSASKDLQNVSAIIALNFHLQENKVGELWQQVGEEYQSRIIDPAIQESVKAATAKYTAEELITKRPQVKDDIKISLIERLNKEFIAVDEVSIVNFDFSESFNAAIEAKVTAEQNALAAKNKLEQVKFEAEQKIATAKADAENIRLQSEAAQNEKYIKLRELDVRMEYAKRWNGTLPINIYGSAPIPFIDAK